MFLSLFIVVGPMLVVRERDHTAKRERMAREGIPVQADIVDRKVVTSGGKHKHTHVDITVKFALENGSNQLARLSLSNDNFKQLALGSDIRLRYLRNDPFHPSVFDEEVHQDSEYVIAGALTVLGLIGVLFGWWPLIRDKWRARKAEG